MITIKHNTREIMKDINGFEIWAGQKVKTLQPRGGFLNPSPAQIGIVEFNENLCKKNELVIRYRIKDRDFDQFILLNGKINEIVTFSCYYCGTFEELMKDRICCATCWNEEMKKLKKELKEWKFQEVKERTK